MTDDDATGPFSRAPRTLWGQQVFAEALQLWGRLDLLTPTDVEDHPLDRKVADEARRLIELAVTLSLRPPARSPRRRLHEWWTGARVEACWTYLRSAELRLVDMHDVSIRQATLRSALAHAHRLPEHDAARLALVELALVTS